MTTAAVEEKKETKFSVSEMKETLNKKREELTEKVKEYADKYKVNEYVEKFKVKEYAEKLKVKEYTEKIKEYNEKYVVKNIETGKEKYKEAFEKMEKQMKETQDSMGKYVEDWRKYVTALPMVTKVEKTVNENLAKVPSLMNLPEKKDIEKLISELEDLSSKVDALSKKAA